MNKDNALKFAKEFIEEVILTKSNINLNKPFDAVINKKYLENDPNLEVLKSELNKYGFDISKTPNSNSWTISKLN